MKARAVIGAQYGDEGKGLMVDYLSSLSSDTMVIRFNGGAQAAHTVVTPEGQRHVFHHFGSGSFVGAHTHLSRFMICNPIMFNRERAELETKGVKPRVTVDPDASVTTPFEMLINQAVESHRGGKRHGSCGLGIGETVEREKRGIGIRVGDLGSLEMNFLRDLRRDWAIPRLEEHGVPSDSAFYQFINDDNILESFLRDVYAFNYDIISAFDHQIKPDHVVFEGAQGLLLDEKLGHFPYVTRSFTGMTNIEKLCRLMNVSHVEAFYVTRCYLTRHGAGPMEDERDISPWFNVVDPTNVPNDWQGTLRFGLLDLDCVDSVIRADSEQAVDSGLVTVKRAVTCLDQATDLRVIRNGEEVEASFDEAAMSYGPTRETMAFEASISELA